MNPTRSASRSGAAAEPDGAARLVDEQRVARKFLHVLLDLRQAARRFAAGDRGERLHVLPLAPRHPGRQAAGPLDRRLRRGAVALEE